MSPAGEFNGSLDRYVHVDKAEVRNATLYMQKMGAIDE
jgi:hypothetical protein